MILPNEARVLRSELARESGGRRRDLVFRVLERRIDEAILAMCESGQSSFTAEVFNEHDTDQAKLELWLESNRVLSVYEKAGWTMELWTNPTPYVDMSWLRQGTGEVPLSMRNAIVTGHFS